jgi:hypothetical protein
VQHIHATRATTKGDNQTEATVARSRRAPEELFSASNTFMSQRSDEDGGAEVEVEEGRSRRGDSIRTLGSCRSTNLSPLPQPPGMQEEEYDAGSEPLSKE